jgi:hypothetical protein
MRIDEAIKELARVVGKWQYGASNSRDSALQLGIEALKRCKAIRIPHIVVFPELLPGETE